jgi:hypothetical protein
MGRASTTIGTSDGRPSILDRSGDGAIPFGQRPIGDPALGPDGAGPALSRAAGAPHNKPPRLEEALAGQEVVLNDLWFQLSLPDRQCFGHRFSGMVLRALGLRPCPAQEVEA